MLNEEQWKKLVSLGWRYNSNTGEYVAEPFRLTVAMVQREYATDTINGWKMMYSGRVIEDQMSSMYNPEWEHIYTIVNKAEVFEEEQRRATLETVKEFLDGLA